MNGQNYAIIAPDGNLLRWTISATRDGAIRALLRNISTSSMWRFALRQGYVLEKRKPDPR